MTVFIIGFVLGGLVTGFVILNNKNKALVLLQKAKELADKEIADLKAKL